MVAIQNTSFVSSRFQYSSFQPGSRTGNSQKICLASFQAEILDLKVKTRTQTQQSLGNQNAVFHFNQLSNEQKSQLVCKGAPISGLSSQEAADLISENGYFGVAKTSQRIAEFVLRGGGEDMDRLKAGRQGVLQGFAQAEKTWGGELPEICYDTLAKTLEAIDARIQDLGGSVVDITG